MKKSHKFEHTSLRCLVIVLAALILLISVVISKEQMQEKKLTDSICQLLDSTEEKRVGLYAQTQDGDMLHIPVADNQAVMEQTSYDGKKSFYLFLNDGRTVTANNTELFYNHQVGLYNMLKSAFEQGTVTEDLTTNLTYSIIKGYDNIIELLINSWQLSEGQALSILSVYGINDGDKDAKLEAAIKHNNKIDTNTYTTEFQFAINIYVEDKAYSVYNGTTYGQLSEELPIYPELYLIDSYTSLNTTKEKQETYVNMVLEYCKQVATKLTTE